MSQLRALSLWEPWASALVDPEGPKSIETRGWATSYRGPIVILAAQHRLSKREIAELPPEVRAYYEDPPRPLQHGHAVGLANLVRIIPAASIEWHAAFFNRAKPSPLDRAWWPDEVEGQPTGRVFVHPEERPWGGYEGEERRAWLFDELRRFGEPIPTKGGQGLRRASSALARAVADELAILDWR